MFSMKIKWVKFAESFEYLDNLIQDRTMMKITINERGLLLIKYDDKFYLVKNKCPHQGIKLDDAKCENGKIICPWHRYGFDLSTGRGAGLYLENYPVQEKEDGIYAGFEYFSWF